MAPGPPIGSRDEWGSDSTFPHQVTPRGPVFRNLDFHWFPVNQWGFEVIGPRTRCPHTEKVLPRSSMKRRENVRFYLCSFDLCSFDLTQTNRKTNFFFRKTLLSVEGITEIDEQVCTGKKYFNDKNQNKSADESEKHIEHGEY